MTSKPTLGGSGDTIPTGNTYDKYEASGVEGRLMANFLSTLSDVLGHERPTQILEVGTGEGVIARRLGEMWPSARLSLVDLHDDDLASSWPPGAMGAFASIDALPFREDSFDLVLAIEVLEHVPDPHAALIEIARVARGRCVLSVPREPIWRLGNMARGRYVRDLGNTPGHIHHWSSRRFARTVGSVLTVDHVRKPFPWTMISATSP